MTFDMKKILISLVMSAATVWSAAAQDTTSTVIGKKLNFEAPLFGVSRKSARPVWSAVALGEVSCGISYRFNAPSRMKPAGYSTELSIMEFRWRPQRNGHLLTAGFSTEVRGHFLKKGWSWDENGGIVATPANRLKAQSALVEFLFNLPVGYVYERGAWKTSFWVVPGYGQTSLRNLYVLGTPVSPDGLGYGGAPDGPTIYVPDKDNRHLEELNGNFGFRLGLKAGVSWNKIGFTVGYDFGHALGSNSLVPRSGILSAGATVRY